MTEHDAPRDHVVEPEAPGDDRASRPWEARTTWLRLLFMLVFVVIWGVSRFVVGVVIIVQFGWVLVTGSPNQRLLSFGQSLATYGYQITLYLMFNTEQRPFPFVDWPKGTPHQGAVGRVPEQ
jgi:hypothetical protein